MIDARLKDTAFFTFLVKLYPLLQYSSLGFYIYFCNLRREHSDGTKSEGIVGGEGRGKILKGERGKKIDIVLTERLSQVFFLFLKCVFLYG